LRETRVERRERERREEAQREAAYRKRVREEERREAAYNERVRKRRREIERELAYEEELENRREKKKKNRRGKVGGVIALILIILFAFTAIRVFMLMQPGSDPVLVEGTGEYGDGRVNVLFLGTNQGLSDTIMVFSFDSKNKRLDAISIPRDTYYSRPQFSGAAFQKVNSVYSSEGPEAACRAASHILGGIPIHYYAVLDTKGAARVIDAMGGVTMYVPIDMNYTDVDQNLFINLQAGTQHLTGEQAVHFARFRSGYATADLGRIGAQQELLKAMMEQAGGLDYAKIAVVASAETKTNMDVFAQVAFASKATSMSGGTFHTHMLPGTTGMKDGLSFFFNDESATRELMRQIYGS